MLFCVVLLGLLATGWSVPLNLVPDIEVNAGEYGDLLEGDIEVYDSSDIPGPKQSPLNAVADPEKLWPDNTLHYQVNEHQFNAAELASIYASVEHLERATNVDGENCIHLVKMEDGESYDDTVTVQHSTGCSSSVGRRKGSQTLSLTSTCAMRNGTVMHEFLHALGYHHEHKRSDRDEWVTINWDNIQEGREHNFNKLEDHEVDLMGTPYDYGSVMHYSEYAFAIDRSEPTIIVHEEDANPGQRTHLSELDVERVKILYGCLDPDDSKFHKGLDISTIFNTV